MTPAEIGLYNGKDYRIDGNGPDEWGCWFLLRHVLRTHYGVQLPLAPVGDQEACRELYAARVRSGEWVPVEFPEDGDPVLMRGGLLPHVGIYLSNDDGGVLHALEEHGVVFSTLGQCRTIGFGNLKFFRIKHHDVSRNEG